MLKVVSVSFNDNPKTYDYFTDLPLKIGDLVVVPAGSFYSVVTVKKVKDESIRATKFVVQKIDLRDFRQRMERMAAS